MSAPHTGRLVAEVDGDVVLFNGDRWSGANVALVGLLNEITGESSNHHYDIASLARRILFLADLDGRYRITEVQADKWTEQLEDDAID